MLYICYEYCKKNIYIFFFLRKIFNMEEILKKYSDRGTPRDVSKCKQKVEKSLSCFSKVAEPDKDFVTEVELLSHFREEIFHVKKVNIIFDKI